MPTSEITVRKRDAAGSQETILWTCLPNGTVGTGQPLDLSVLVSPRLTNGSTGTLADYPHFLDWPQTLRSIGAYGVVLFTRIPSPQEYLLPAALTPPADDPQAIPDSALWAALFPPDTPVRSYATDDYSSRFVLSYPAANIYNIIKGFYQQVGVQSPGDFPVNTELLDTFGLKDIVVTASYQGGYLNNNQAPLPLSLPTGEAFETFLAGLKPKPAPTGLTATADSYFAVDLSWNAAAGATGYNLARYNPSQGDYEFLNQNGPLTATTYIDSNVAPLTTYSYEVMAIYPDGPSAYSSPVSVTTGQEIVRAVPRAASGEPRTFSDTPPAEVPLDLPTRDSSFQPTQAQWDTLRLQVFHHPRSQTVDTPIGSGGSVDTRTQLAPLPDPGDFQNTLDFHQRVAMLAKYPALMRRLGLILDLTLPAEALPPESTISLSPPLSAPVVSITPQTALASGFGFQALSGDPTLRNGQLDLGPDSPHSLVEVDIDGAAFKLLRLANTLLVSNYRPSVDTPVTTSVAALRSGGLSLVRSGRAAWLSTKFITAAQQNADAETNSTILYAEDLVRGYRVDISDSVDATWRSLVQRIGSYVVAGTPYGTHQDEAIVQLAATQPPNAPGGTTDLYLHESLLRWDGWSLAAPRPFLTIGETGVEAPGTVPGLNLMVGFQPVPGSLPRLRFGRAYQVRARTVDLAGNSLSLTQVSTPLATDPKTYARYEPVPAPEVVLREAPGLAESLTRLVIRSPNANPTLDHVPTSAISERHIAPPQAGEDIAEAHGMFDGPSGVREDSYAVIVAGEGAFSQISVPNATGTPSLYPLDTDAQAKVPYLPDPLCAGAALRFLPGVPGSRVTAIPYGTNWPALPPFRIVLQEGPFASVFNAGARVLTVSMPKGQTVTVRMSSYLPPNAPGPTPMAALEIMGIWRWIEEAEGVSSRQLATLRALAAQGSHWMLTPYRDLHLVHAVQQPLVTPTLAALVPTKTLGSTYATFTGLLSCDGNTTAVLDMLAQWQEPFDDPTGAPPTMGVINGKAHAFQIPLRFPLDALGRFPIGNPVPVLGQGGQTAAEYDTVHEVLTLVGDPARHEFGDTKYRRVAYTPVGTSRFKEYFDLPENSSAVDDYDNPYTRRQASPTVVDILNSARPAAPKVLYVLPAFRFASSADGTQSTRLGGLRVYLDRPWWSSGDGELLGVVLWNATYTRHITGIGPRREINLPDMFAPYVTQWGADPLWVADAPTTLPDITDFTNEADTSGAAETAGFTQFGLTLEELPGETVGVAPYAVGFDSDRNLWYSDIDINPQSYYFPFIRLALARCQPYSVPNAHLSRVVLAQFAQLTPDRSVSLVQNGRTLSITLVGVAPGESLGRQNIVRVGFESRPQADGGDDLGWTPLPINGYDTTEALQDQVGNPSLQGYTTGVVPLPGADAGSAFRLVVREYEELDSTHAALPGAAYGRLIYADTLDVTTFVNG
jgi:hypothetical protein